MEFLTTHSVIISATTQAALHHLATYAPTWAPTDTRVYSHTCGREVTTVKVLGPATEETVSPEVAQVFRKRIGVHLNESQAKPVLV